MFIVDKEFLETDAAKAAGMYLTSKKDVMNLLIDRKSQKPACFSMDSDDYEVVFFRYRDEEGMDEGEIQQEIHFCEDHYGKGPVICYRNNADRSHYYFPTNEEYDEMIEAFYTALPQM